MPTVADKTSWRQRANSIIANIIANVFGQRVYYALRYYRQRHHLPNFKNPKDLSERILAAMLSKDFLKYSVYADKVEVREYVKNKGLGHILLKQYGAWDDASLIPFDKLPNQFILKANNGCGGHIICTDKAELDIPGTVTVMNSVLRRASHLINTEPHYCAIKPKILAEELMGDGSSLPIDYKFVCIKGEVCFIQVICDRETGMKQSVMDTEWHILPFLIHCSSQAPSKPDHLSEMLDVAKKLSSDFDFVRVDLYEYKDNVYFGELTFSPMGGMFSNFTTEAIELLGNRFEELSNSSAK